MGTFIPTINRRILDHRQLIVIDVEEGVDDNEGVTSFPVRTATRAAAIANTRVRATAPAFLLFFPSGKIPNGWWTETIVASPRIERIAGYGPGVTIGPKIVVPAGETIGIENIECDIENNGGVVVGKNVHVRSLVNNAGETDIDGEIVDIVVNGGDVRLPEVVSGTSTFVGGVSTCRWTRFTTVDPPLTPSPLMKGVAYVVSGATRSYESFGGGGGGLPPTIGVEGAVLQEFPAGNPVFKKLEASDIDIDAGEIAPSRVPFTFSSASPLTITTVQANDVIEEVVLVIETPFDDPAATVQIGTFANPSLVFAAVETDVTLAGGQFSNPLNEVAPVADSLILTLSPAASTAGSGYILFRLRR